MLLTLKDHPLNVQGGGPNKIPRRARSGEFGK